MVILLTPACRAMPSMESFCSETGPGGWSPSRSIAACRTALRLASLRTAMEARLRILAGASRISLDRTPQRGDVCLCPGYGTGRIEPVGGLVKFGRIQVGSPEGTQTRIVA